MSSLFFHLPCIKDFALTLQMFSGLLMVSYLLTWIGTLRLVYLFSTLMDCWITLPSCSRIDEKLPPLCTYLVFPFHFFYNQSSHIILIINFLPITTKTSNSLITMRGNPIKANTGKSVAKFPPSIADVEQVGTRLGSKALVPLSPSGVVSTSLSNLSSPSTSETLVCLIVTIRL